MSTFKVYKKKIDIYLKSLNGYWKYECSTMASPSCKSALHNFCVRHGLDKSQVKARFSK